MQRVKVLLIDNSSTTKKLLEETRLNGEPAHLTVRQMGTRIEAPSFDDAAEGVDVILFGERVSPKTIVQHSKAFRDAGITTPILLVTKQSEARVSSKLRKAGVDDLLNIIDLRTPLFLWSFQSTLRRIEERKKAREFDLMRTRLQNASKSLAFITHEINNPLSVIRLALYHLENPKLARGKKETFLRLLLDNVAKVDTQMKALYGIRRQLGQDIRLSNPRSSLKSVKQAVASH